MATSSYQNRLAEETKEFIEKLEKEMRSIKNKSTARWGYRPRYPH